MEDGVFFSSVICERAGKEEIIDSRSRDAIALAIRFDAPIYTYEKILKKAGIIIKIEKNVEEKSLINDLFENKKIEINKKSLEELKELLNSAINDEDYESAAKIRDEISKRK